MKTRRAHISIGSQASGLWAAQRREAFRGGRLQGLEHEHDVPEVGQLRVEVEHRRQSFVSERAGISVTSHSIWPYLGLVTPGGGGVAARLSRGMHLTPRIRKGNTL